METNSVGSVSSNNSSGFWDGLAGALMRGIMRSIPIVGFLGLLASGGCDENPSQTGLEDGSFIEVNNANPSRPAPDAGVPILPPIDADVTFDAEMASDAETVGDTDVDAIGDAETPSTPCEDREFYDGCFYSECSWSGDMDGVEGGGLQLSEGRISGSYTTIVEGGRPDAVFHRIRWTPDGGGQPMNAGRLDIFVQVFDGSTWHACAIARQEDGALTLIDGGGPVQGERLEIIFDFSTTEENPDSPVLQNIEVDFCGAPEEVE